MYRIKKNPFTQDTRIEPPKKMKYSLFKTY